MNYLLDTHVFLWWLFDDARLSAIARGIIRDRDNTVFVSSASAWEISTKYRLGRLPAARVLVQDIASFVDRAGFRELPILVAHGQKAGSFPHAHRDPFDRVLAAQAAIEGYHLVTGDPALAALGAMTVW